jgi:hypothetical protein
LFNCTASITDSAGVEPECGEYVFSSVLALIFCSFYFILRQVFSV